MLPQTTAFEFEPFACLKVCMGNLEPVLLLGTEYSEKKLMQYTRYGNNCYHNFS